MVGPNFTPSNNAGDFQLLLIVGRLDMILNFICSTAYMYLVLVLILIFLRSNSIEHLFMCFRFA